ncbi:MAG: transcription termination factor Rho [Bacteroidaceae bacterium]|nr:transcription termination factor Rho [Bacteroidaceae bacterium]
MHTKSELESLSIDELTQIARDLDINVKDSDSQIDLIYSIIGAESDRAVMGQSQATPAPKKRVRKSKAEKEADDSVEPEPVETADSDKKSKKATKEKKETTSSKTATAEQETEAAAPKKRGRKSKAEKDAEAAAQQAAEAEKQSVDVEEQPADTAATATEVTADDSAADTDANGVEFQPDSSVTEAPADDSTINVEAFFNNDEPDIIIIKDVEPIVASAPQATNAELGKGKNKAADMSTPLQELTNIKQAAAASPRHTESAVQAASAFNSRPQYDFSNLIKVEGVLEVNNDGTGFLRSSDYYYMPSPDDVFVSAQQIKQIAMKTGDVVEGSVRPPRDNERHFILTSIDFVNGMAPERLRNRQIFENLTPLFPNEKFKLCSGHNDSTSVRVVDLFSPIGKGQRALIVAQPKTGKTILMKDIANAIAANHPEAYLMMLLIDERPEEVTDMARTVNAEVIASTFDEPADHHVKIANIVLEKAKRMVECGHDVVIFLDSITRLARAFNTVAPGSGKILTGGVDSNALQKPKRFFGAARNIEGGGSLTIIATALIDTGSKMDEVIFEEFKGTGNMELQLDRTLANKRIFPAVNLVASSTRRDELLHDKLTQDRMWILRKYLSDMNSVEAMTEMKKRLEDTRDNEEFLISMNS